VALGKEVFAECPLAGTWQTITAMTGNGRGERMQRTHEAVSSVARVALGKGRFAECL